MRNTFKNSLLMLFYLGMFLLLFNNSFDISALDTKSLSILNIGKKLCLVGMMFFSFVSSICVAFYINEQVNNLRQGDK